jgi:type IV secretory pathway VirB2 component (pilin)
MQKIIRKKTTALIMLFFTAALQAQEIDLETPVKDITDQIKGIFPYIAGAIFLIVVLVNLGHFIKENGDWKKGLMNIIIYVIIIGVVAGFFQFITSVNL